MRYTLVERKEYDVDLLPQNIFEELERKFPVSEVPSLCARAFGTGGKYRFRPYSIDVFGTKRILSTEAKEVQQFIDIFLKEGDKNMSYFSSPKQYEVATGKRFTTNCSCIHVTGSVKGMVKLGYWSKNSDKVKHGNWIYQQP